MATYGYALDEDGKVISIKDVTNRKKKYLCIGCGCEMTPAQGEKNEWHFRHKNDESACVRYESYLHKLGKRILKERFDLSDSFVIEIEKENSCEKKETCKLAKSLCKSKYFDHEIDLKKLYDKSTEEKGDKKAKADVLLENTLEEDETEDGLMLQSDIDSRKPIFLEVAVTHRCSEKKKNSGEYIVEFDVKNEEDAFGLMNVPIKWPMDYNEETSKIRFYGFNRKNGHPKHPLKKIALKKDGTIDRENNSVVCDDWENHSEDNVIEVVAPKEDRLDHILIVEGNANGKGLWHCKCCIHFYVCKIKPTTIISFQDPNTGQIRQVRWGNIGPMSRPTICNSYSLDLMKCASFVITDVYDSWIKQEDETRKE